MIRIGIAEDDRVQMKTLKGYLDRYFGESGEKFEIACYSDGDRLTDYYRAEFDIIFMDVEMPFIDGFTAAKMIREKDPEVVILFITSHAQYAIKGYSVEALDYILKPVSYFAFSQYMDRAVERTKRRKEKYIAVHLRTGMKKLPVSRIYYVESQDHHLIFHAKDGEVTTLGKIQDMEEKTKEYGFLRCHIGYLINPEHVEGIRENSVLVHGEALPISRSRKKKFLEELMDYMNG